MSPVKLSILIVTWQSGADVEPCLDSIHSRREFEVVVVDNASTDETRERLAGYHHLRVIANRRNLGYARASNQGLAVCRGEYVLLLNPDAKLEPGSLDLLVDHLDARPEHAAVAPQLLNPDGTLQHSVRGLPTPAAVFWELSGVSLLFPHHRSIGRIRMAWFDYDRAGPAPQPMASCLLIHRQALTALGGFDERFPMLYNDVDLSKRMLERGMTTWYLPESRVIHARGTSTGKVKPRMLREQYRSLIRYLARHDRSGQQHRRLEVDAQRVEEVRLGCLVEVSDDVDAGVVHQDVERAELRFGPFEQAGAVLGDRDVTDRRDGGDPHRLDLRSHPLEVIGTAGRERQVHALLGERLRDVHADPT